MEGCTWWEPFGFFMTYTIGFLVKELLQFTRDVTLLNEENVFINIHSTGPFTQGIQFFSKKSPSARIAKYFSLIMSKRVAQLPQRTPSTSFRHMFLITLRNAGSRETYVAISIMNWFIHFGLKYFHKFYWLVVLLFQAKKALASKCGT